MDSPFFSQKHRAKIGELIYRLSLEIKDVQSLKPTFSLISKVVYNAFCTSNPKHRCLNKRNEAFNSKLLCYPSFVEIILFLGFVEQDDKFFIDEKSQNEYNSLSLFAQDVLSQFSVFIFHFVISPVLLSLKNIKIFFKKVRWSVSKGRKRGYSCQNRSKNPLFL